MAISNLSGEELLRRTVIEVAGLSESDLLVVLEVVDDLKQRSPVNHTVPVADILARARRRAAELQDMPRENLMASFINLTERMRARAIERGTAIDGDWESD